MLEAIRVHCFGMNAYMRNLCDRWNADICPNIQKRLEITKDQHRFWHVIPTGGHLFEVRNGSEAFGVDEERNKPLMNFIRPRPQIARPRRILKFIRPRPRSERILKKQLAKKVFKAGVTMTCTNCHQKGHNKKGCKNPTVVLPPKPPAKKGRPKKTPLVGSSLIDEEIETPDVDEQVGQFDVRGEEQVRVKRGGSAQFGVQRGRRVKTTVKRGGAGYRRGSVPSRRFSNLGRWFGLGEKAAESDPIENSEMAQETNQNAANDSFAATQETHQFSATAFASTQNSQNHQVSEQEPQAAKQEPQRCSSKGILNFIRPRPRSERILKKQLAKKVHGIGSTSSNALNLE
ncbi:hypothetical protein Tco_0982196 [Tanacetum coccineum]